MPQRRCEYKDPKVCHYKKGVKTSTRYEREAVNEVHHKGSNPYATTANKAEKDEEV